MKWITMMTRPVLVLLLLGGLASVASAAQVPAEAPSVEYALTIWDWTKNYRDLARFRGLVDESEALGFNTIELSVAWKDVQPAAADKFQWDYTDQRIEYVLGKGLRLRVRINFSYAHPWPKWVAPELAERFDGKAPATIMTIFDDRLNGFQATAAETIVSHYKGREIEWCPVFGVHTEHKLSSWLSYEPAARAALRKWLKTRYGSLDDVNRAWGQGFQNWEEIQPPVVDSTTRRPDLTRATCDWIAFREEAIAEKIHSLLAAVKKGDPGCATSVVLGESFRRQSADMANLAYRPYSREADRVVFAYDFSWHGPKRLDEAVVSLAIMQGVSGKPTLFEFGGPACIEHDGYSEEDLVSLGRLVLDSGAAGLNMCNYCYSDEPLAKYRHLQVLGREVAKRNAQPRLLHPRPKSLYYVSKWANYALRDTKSEWVHETQLGLYRQLRAQGQRPRIISDDNLLAESFERVTQIYVGPPLVIDSRAAARLRELAGSLKIEPPEPLKDAVILQR